MPADIYEFILRRPSEREAGITSVYERVTISFEYGGWDKADVVGFFTEVLAEFVDGTAELDTKES